MAVLVRCPNRKCRLQNSIDRPTCKKCGTEIPAGIADYVLAWKDSAGNRNTKTLRRVTREHAQKRYDELIQARATDELRGVQVSHRQKGHSVKSVLTNYVESFNDGKHKCYPTFRWAAALMKQVLGNETVEGLTKEKIYAAMESIKKMKSGKGKPVTEYAINAALKVARAAVNKLDIPNPFSKIRRYKVNDEKTLWLNDAQIESLIRVARQHGPQWIAEMIEVSLLTGLRRDNVLGLRRSQVDSISKTIRVKQKGDRALILPVSDRVLNLLARIPDNGTPYFWVTTRGKPFIMPGPHWATIKKLADLPAGFRWHDMRHTFISHIVMKTGNLALASRLAGHKDIKMTMRYAHLADSLMADAVNQVFSNIRM